jgi:hypothetical protein
LHHPEPFFQGFGDASVQRIHLLKQQSSQIKDSFSPATGIDFRRTEIAASGLQPGVRRKPGGRLLRAHKGRCLLKWRRQVVMCDKACENFCQKMKGEAGVR